MRTIVLTLVLACGLPGLVQAGPWSRSPGELYVKAGEGFFIADTYVDSSGVVREGTSYLGATTFAYYEVGLAPGFHVQGYMPYTVARNTFDDGRRFLQAGGGDAQVALQWSPPWKLTSAIRVELKLPMYDVRAAGGPLGSFFPAFGDGQLDVTAWLSIGGSIPNTPMWVWAEAGHRFRTEAYVGQGDTRTFLDSFVFAGQLGTMIGERAFVGVGVSGVTPYRLDQYTKAYLVVGPSGGVFLGKGFAVEASFDPIIWSRNSSRGPGFGFGLSYKR